jgi:hypothetical protein
VAICSPGRFPRSLTPGSIVEFVDAVTVGCMENNDVHNSNNKSTGLVATGTCRYFDENAVQRQVEARRQEEIERSRAAHPSSGR